MEKTDRIVSWICLLLGIVGAAGQSYILSHELIYSYPYKMMDEPPAYLYAMEGRSGAFCAMTLTISIAFLAARYLLDKPGLITAVPVVLCPIFYVLSFELMCGFNSMHEMRQPNFDGYTGESVRHLFTFTAFWLAVWGAVIGFISGFLIEKAGSFWKRASMRNTVS